LSTFARSQPIADPAATGSPRPRFLAGDIRGGLAVCVVDLALVPTLAVLVFGPLGPAHLESGVRAAFTASILGGVTATLLGGVPVPGTGPRAATCLILGTFIGTLALDPRLRSGGAPDVAAILCLAAACVCAAGVLQLVFGMVRLGSLVKFVPYPVLSGLMTGIAILIVLSQLPGLLGVAGPLKSGTLADALRAAQPWTVFVGLATATLAWVIAAFWPRLPAWLLAIAAGSVAYHVIAAVVPSARLGDLLAAASGPMSMPTALAPLFPAGAARLLETHGASTLATAFALAVVGSLDSLFAAAAADAAHDTRHRPNRELVGQGCANIVSGLFGGLPLSLGMARVGPAFRAGARTRASGLVAAATLLLVYLVAGGALGLVPLAALAGIMLVVAAGLVDRWSRDLPRRLVRGHPDRDTLWSFAVVLIVCVATVAFGFVVAVVVGVIASMALFIAAMNRSLVRASWTGAQRASRRVYPAAEALALNELGRTIRVIELEGAVFFGTAERLAVEVERSAAAARAVILDFRRVSAIDATGALILERLSRRLAATGVRLLLAHVTPEGRHGQALVALGPPGSQPRADWCADVDRALEAAERALLAERGSGEEAREVPLEASSLLAGLAPAEVERVRSHLERSELGAGEVLFREGEPGDRLYVLTRGAVSILAGRDHGAQRLVTMAPGVAFGEMAMLDRVPRSATAVADEPSTVYCLTAAGLEAIRAGDPELAVRLVANLARHLSNRLRLLTDALRAETDAGDWRALP
jgi:MFS superfamily sulfate permease-like transporter